MTTVIATADRVRARAGQIDPVKLLVVLVSVVPWLLFAAARVVWLVLSLLIAAGLEGWDAADRAIDTSRVGVRREGRGG